MKMNKIKEKKKYAPIIEFPSEDLDPKLYKRENENDELQKLRDDLEKEISEKKLEIANRIKKESKKRNILKHIYVNFVIKLIQMDRD